MKTNRNNETLLLARRDLNGSDITGEKFKSAMTAILTRVDRLKPWSALVDAAYERLPHDYRLACRYLMISFHYNNHDYAAASRFIPRHYDGSLGIIHWAYGEATVEAILRKKESVRLSIPKCCRAVTDADSPELQGMLINCVV